MIVYGILGTVQSASTLYFALTLTTIEKRFKIPSQTTGIMLSGNEISQIMLSLFLTYFGGQQNRPRWIAWGVVLGALSCFMLALPHYIYGAGEDALLLTKEYLSDRNVSNPLESTPIENTNDKFCSNTSRQHDDCDEGHEVFTYLPLVLIFMSQFVLGIGNTLYFSLGQSYLDDNTKQRNTPLMLAYAFGMRMCGPLIGFVLSYFIMNVYIDPRYTPTIQRNSPQWLGAYWLGWNMFGALQLLIAVLIGLFPKNLPKRKKLKVKNESDNEKGGYLSGVVAVRNDDAQEKVEWKNFPAALMRLLTNKLIIFNNIAAIFYILSATTYITFIGRVMEVQFNTSAHGGSILTGPATILGMIIGILSSGFLITKYKPPAKYLFLWNAIIALISTSSQIVYTQIGCNGDASLVVNGTMSSCNTDCKCDGIPYSPVCDQTAGITYFSPCHAGCRAFDKEAKLYTDCSCSDYDAYNETIKGSDPFISPGFDDGSIDAHGLHNAYENSQYDQDNVATGELAKRNFQQTQRIVTPSSCSSDCKSGYYIFAIVSTISGLIGSTGRIGNVLLSFRAVEKRDKSFSQGLSLFSISLFALIPGPIIYGRIIDNTCMIWNYKCGRRGDCQLYNPIQFRQHLHAASAFFLFMAFLFDLLVWHYGKNLELYGDDDTKKAIEKGTIDDESAESQPLNKIDVN
ncbi:hypothetical protein HA402_003115 [Bradysia odoriphaga]|nr:hypothetical protein HA402_003115 [Bradysia odoriphaga]